MSKRVYVWYYMTVKIDACYSIAARIQVQCYTIAKHIQRIPMMRIYNKTMNDIVQEEKYKTAIAGVV